MKQQKFHIKIITTLDDQLIHQWKALWEESEHATLYNSYEWFLTWLETNNSSSYKLHACYNDDILVALLPLQSYRCFGVKVLGTLCKEYLLKTSFLIKNYDKKLITFFFESLLNKNNLYFQKFDKELTTLLHESFPQFFISLISVNPTVHLQGYPVTPISKNTISKIKKIARKNAEQLQFSLYSKDLEKHLETVFMLQENSAKKARSMDIFADQKTKTYYKTLAKQCSKFVRISILSYNAVPIAYEYGFLCKENYTGDQISYHIDYKKLSPGKLIVYKLIEALQKENVKIIDQGGGISSYKLSFTQDYQLLYNIYYSPHLVTMYWWKLINSVRRIKQILFPKKNTRDHEFLFRTF